MRKLVLVFSLIALIYSCKDNADRYSDKYALSEVASEANDVIPITRQMASTPAAPVPPQDNLVGGVAIEKKIIKDANIGIEVKDYQLFRIKLDSLIRSINGYISNDYLYNNDESINCDLVIRIPERNFDKFMQQVEKGTEKTLYKNISSRDVTEEFIDIDARLKNKKSVEKRYAQLLIKAKTVKDILEIEEKLRVIREEIESTQGRLNYLSSQVSFSTINLTITQKLDYKFRPSSDKGFFQLLIKSLHKGWKALLQFILFVFNLWPFLIIIAVGVLVFIKYRNRKKEKKHKKDK
jgi:hypothetical protein